MLINPIITVEKLITLGQKVTFEKRVSQEE
jgi:hypothetical protein